MGFDYEDLVLLMRMTRRAPDAFLKRRAHVWAIGVCCHYSLPTAHPRGQVLPLELSLGIGAPSRSDYTLTGFPYRC